MTIATSRTLGAFALPEGFAVRDFDLVNERVARRAGSDENAWHGFASAWNGIAYRLRGTLEHASAVSKSLTISSAPPPEDRYRQDHDLFGFFISSVSTIECFCFAAHCIGSLLVAGGFPLQTAGHLKFRTNDVRTKYKTHFPGDSLAKALDSVLTAGEYSQLVQIRNVMAHRGTPPRQHFLSTSGPDTPSAIPSNLADPASAWQYDLHLSPSSLDPLVEWVKRAVADLVAAAGEFARSRL